MKNKIIGRELTWKEVLQLPVGTKVWIKEGDFSCNDNISVVTEDKLVEENIRRRYYKKEDLRRLMLIGKMNIFEVCVLDDVQAITFEQAARLEDGTKVFVSDSTYLGGKGEFQWVTKKGNTLRCDDGTSYNPIDGMKGNDYTGRTVNLYVSKDIKIAEPENNGFKVGDRVLCIESRTFDTFCKTGTVVSIDGSNDTIGVEFDEDMGGHTCLGRGKLNHCAWFRSEHLQHLDTVHFNVPLERDILPMLDGFKIGQRVNTRYGMGTVIDFCTTGKGSIGVSLDKEKEGLHTCSIGANRNYTKISQGKWFEKHEINQKESVAEAEVKTEVKEEKGDEIEMGQKKEFSIGDRVNHKKFGLGTIIDKNIWNTLLLVEFDVKRIGLHNGNGMSNVRGKDGHCYFMLDDEIEVAKEEAVAVKEVGSDAIKISIKGRKTTVEYDGEKATSRCNPSDVYDRNIGIGIALERLGEKLQKKALISSMTKEDFADFIRGGKVVINCKSEQAAKKLLSTLDSLGIRWTSGESMERNNWNDYKTVTCYRIIDNGKLCYGYVDFYKSEYKVVEFK